MSDQPRRTGDQPDFTFQAGEHTAADLLVLGFSGREGLSRLFEFRVELCTKALEIACETMLGAPCALEIAGAGGSRWVHGMIRRFERTGDARGLTYYAAEVVPVHWLLTRRIGSRIFQKHVCDDMSVPGIVQKVFQTAGIAADAYRLALSESYPARDYVVQYRESEFDFISRLMEDEGIYYFFEHGPKGHTMVLADAPAAHVVSPVDGQCAYRELTGLTPDREYVHSLREAAEIQIGTTRLKEFDYLKPSLDLHVQSAAGEHTALEFSDYPGKYAAKEDGSRLAKVRLQEQQCRKRVLYAAGSVRGPFAGHTVTLSEHPKESLNREYLVTEITHRATQPQAAEVAAQSRRGSEYEAQWRLIPSDVPFRPPRATARPVVRGSQTARVVGPSGEEIYTDDEGYGRVKVQFHWDLEGQFDENSSCWVRVSHAMVGGQYGMLFLPRVGQEVIVDFLEGDPDRPIITGRVHNADHLPPYKLPDEKTRSVIKTHSSKDGGGTNEISFDDKKDSEKLLVFAQKDLHLRAVNDRIENVGRDHHLTVEENRHELVKKNSHVEIKLDLNAKVGGKRSLKVEGDCGTETGGNHSLTVGGKLYLKSDQEVVIEAANGLTLKVGGNFVKIDGSGVTIVGSQTLINSGGSAGSASVVSLAAPEKTLDADKTQPGKDTRYSPGQVERGRLDPSREFEPARFKEKVVKPRSWVEIEMVDEEGQPWRNEYYEVTLPDGTVYNGFLNDEGRAHVLLPEKVTTQVSFPKLDAEAWERKA